MSAEWNAEELTILMDSLYLFAGDVDRDMSTTREMVAAIEIIHDDLVLWNTGVPPKSKLQIARQIRARVEKYKRFSRFLQEESVEYDEETNVVTISTAALSRGVPIDDEEFEFWLFGLEYHWYLSTLVEQNKLGKVNYEEVIEEVTRLELPNGAPEPEVWPYFPIVEYPIHHH